MSVTDVQTGPSRIRSDALASRSRLVDGVGTYLSRTGEVPTRLADIAKESTIGLATAYRHFTDANAVVDEFILRLPRAAAATFKRKNKTSLTPVARFNQWNRAWVDACLEYGVAATRLRSSTGFLQRRASGDPIVAFVCSIVEPLLREIAAETQSDPVDLLWIWNAISDPREVTDQHVTRHRSAARIAASITQATIALADNP